MTQMNLSMTQNKIRDIENRLVIAKVEGGGRGKTWKFGISRCKLVYIEWINNKLLLYSTGNYIQYPMMSHNRKEYVCVCITESLCCTAEIKHNIVNQLHFTTFFKKLLYCTHDDTGGERKGERNSN